MVRSGLEIAARRVAPDRLETMLRTGHPRLGSAEATAVVQAGNIPALALLEVVVTLLSGSTVAVKLSSAEPLTGLLLVQQLRRHFAPSAPPASAFAWTGGDAAREGALLEWARRLFAYGNDSTIADLRARHHAANAAGRFQGFGHRVSAAYLPRGGFPLGEACQRVAFDVAMWDQEGCLSPHVLFVDDRLDRAGVCESLAAALGRLDGVLPIGERAFDRRVGLRRLHSDLAARMIRDEGTRVWRGGDDLRWTVALVPRGPLRPSPLGRTIVVRPCASDSEMIESLATWYGRLQCLGVAAPPEAYEHLARPLAMLGASRLCSAGRMQEPGPIWFGEEAGIDGRRTFAIECETDGAWARFFTGSDPEGGNGADPERQTGPGRTGEPEPEGETGPGRKGG
jgi:hypothetical protein